MKNNKFSLKSLAFLGLLLPVTFLMACGGGGGGGGVTPVGSTDEIADYTFTQPLAGMVLSGGEAIGVAYVDLFMLDGSDPETVQVASSAQASEPGLESAITAMSPTSAEPFQLLTITGTGFQTGESAISIIFRADGLEPVVVPAIAVTSTTVQVAVPALIDPDGESVAGRAQVQIFQVGEWGFSITAAYDGLDIEELPEIDSQVVAGAVLDAYLTSAQTLIAEYEETAPGDLPDSFWSRLATLKTDLAQLQDAVQEVMADPAATPAVAASGAGSVTLSAESLALADRLVAALLLRLGEEFDFVTTEVLPMGIMAVSDCPPLTSGGWVDDFLCEEQRFKQRRAELAPKAFMLGVKIETSIFLGLFGGVSSNLVGLVAPKAVTAFKLAWSAVSGHITAWVVGDEPPPAGETLAEVGVTALDTYAGTYGIPNAVYSAMRMGRESDAIIAAAREGLAPAPTPPPVSGTGSFQGEISGTATETGPGCRWQHSLLFTVTVTDFGGAGTMIDPYRGDVALSGVDTITLIESDGWCDEGDELAITGTGVVEGDAGKVEIAAEAVVGSGIFTFDLQQGTHDGTTISGPYLIMGDGLDENITGTATLTAN